MLPFHFQTHIAIGSEMSSLALQVSPSEQALVDCSSGSSRLETSPTTGESASGGDSSMLADLTAMFPSLEHEVIVTVLAAHEGRIQAAVEYLMTTDDQARSEASLPLLSMDHTASYDPARDMVGQFSVDIGGLPEMLPAILCEGDLSLASSARTEREDEQGNERELEGGGPGELSVQPDSDGEDHLPTYEEACRESSGNPLIPEGDSDLAESGVEAVSPVEATSAEQEEAEETTDKKKSKSFCLCDKKVHNVHCVQRKGRFQRWSANSLHAGRATRLFRRRL